MTALHVLLVDDEPLIQKALEQYLTQAGLKVGCAGDGVGLDQYLANHKDIDIIVMDLSMPGEDGLAITRRLRSSGQTIPIIMVSSFGSEVDRIVGLEMGVDDYLGKPANPRELLARIKALMRRRNLAIESPAQASPTTYPFGDFILDCKERILRQHGKEISLTTAEFNLLKLFVESPQQELDRNTLMERLKGYEHTPFDRSIDVRVRRLRQKIEDDPAKPRYILTVWGKGYLFVPEGKGGENDQ